MQSIVSQELPHIHDAGRAAPELDYGRCRLLDGLARRWITPRGADHDAFLRTGGEGSLVVAAFGAVAASGWLWAQAPKRSAAVARTGALACDRCKNGGAPASAGMLPGSLR